MNTVHKPRLLVVLKIALLSLVIMILSYNGQSNAKEADPVKLNAAKNKAAKKTETRRTALMIVNSTSDQIDAAVVLADLGGACGPNNPPVTANQLESLGFCSNVINSANPPYAGKCMLTIGAKSFVAFPDIPGACISGNVTFGDYPGCPNDSYPEGFTTGEFTLNTDGGLEVVDISLVNGHNNNVSISMYGGGEWSYGKGAGTPISLIVSKPSGENIGNPGVYPEGCSDCVEPVGDVVCPDFNLYPDCQTDRICDVYRSAANSGGTVTVSYMGK